jgi:hypothetical protein
MQMRKEASRCTPENIAGAEGAVGETETPEVTAWRYRFAQSSFPTPAEPYPKEKHRYCQETLLD